MANNKDPENKKLNKDDHKGISTAAKLAKFAGGAILTTYTVLKNKDKLEDVVKVATKVIFK